MTVSQRKAIRLSEIRERLNVLLNTETRTAEQETELVTLTNESATCEREYRAALTAEDVPTGEAAPTAEDAETRERRALARDARVGAFIASAVSGKPIDGRERELSDAYHCNGMLPIAAFEHDRPPETRAVTPGITAVQQAAPTAPYVFERSAAASLGFQFPTVASGQQNYPVLTTAPPAGVLAKSAAALATAGAFRLDTRSPKRVAGQFVIRTEDAAVFPSIEQDLRESLMDASSNALDEAIFSADDGTGGTLNGLLNQAADVAIAGAVEAFNTAISRFAALVDGQYAYGFGDLRAVIGSATFAKYASIFANSDKGDISAYDTLMGKLGSLRVSNRVPDVAATGQKAIVTLNAASAPLRIPTWMGMEIIVDPYTQAGKGEKVCTATMLVGDPHIPYTTNQLKELHPKLS
jgi:hypothetical protein